MDNTSSGFWTGGCEAFDEALRQEYVPLLKDLRRQREACTDESSHAALEDELRAKTAEYRSRQKAAKWLLF